MIYTHTIGRIGAKDCRVITGTHGTFMAVDIAVDDYSKGKQITTWVRVKSSKENRRQAESNAKLAWALPRREGVSPKGNHIRLA